MQSRRPAFETRAQPLNPLGPRRGALGRIEQITTVYQRIPNLGTSNINDQVNFPLSRPSRSADAGSGASGVSAVTPRSRRASHHPIAILRGWACLAFGRVSVSTPSSRLALIFSWSIVLESAKDRA
jgi:hypothetical protein